MAIKEEKTYVIDVERNNIAPNDRMYLLSFLWTFDPNATFDGSQIIYKTSPANSAHLFALLRSEGSSVIAENTVEDDTTYE